MMEKETAEFYQIRQNYREAEQYENSERCKEWMKNWLP